MRKLSLLLILTANLSISCQNLTTEVDSPVSTSVPTSTPAADITQTYPEIGTPTELVQGDLLCYATIVDEEGTTHHLGTTFELCAEQDTYLNQKVRFLYALENVADCESIEPCGKTRQETLITEMTLLGESD